MHIVFGPVGTYCPSVNSRNGFLYKAQLKREAENLKPFAQNHESEWAREPATSICTFDYSLLTIEYLLCSPPHPINYSLNYENNYLPIYYNC